MRSRLGVAFFVLLSLGTAHAQDANDEKKAPTTDRLFDIAKGLLDDRVAGNKGPEHKKLLKALDAIIDETTFGEGDTSKYSLTGKPVKVSLSRRNLTAVADEEVHETSIDSSFVVAENFHVTSVTGSIVIVRDSFSATGCDNCLVVCLGDAQCTTGDGSVIVVKGRAGATQFRNCAVLSKDANLVPELDADYKALVEKLDDRGRVRLDDAKSLLAQPQAQGRDKALRIIRKLRVKAAIPLLLQYMHQSDDREALGKCGRTLLLLTGETVTPPADVWSDPSRRLAVRKWVKEKWSKDKDALGTDLEKLDRPRLDRIAHELVAIALEGASLKAEDLESAGGAENAHRVLGGLLDRDAVKSDAILPEDVSPCLVPVLLDRATDAGGAFAMARVLAAFYRKGELAGIDKIGADEAKPAFVRLAALLAAWVAGEDFPTEPVLAMLGKAKKLEDKIALVLALGKTKDQKLVAKLGELVGDKNWEIRDAALYAIGDIRPKTLPDAVKALPEKKDDWADDAAVLHAISSVKGDKEAMGLLAKALSEAVKDAGDNGSKAVHDRLVAFERVSGQSWHNERYPRPPMPRGRGNNMPDRTYMMDVRPAKAALDWWEGEKDK